MSGVVAGTGVKVKGRDIGWSREPIQGQGAGGRAATRGRVRVRDLGGSGPGL